MRTQLLRHRHVQLEVVRLKDRVEKVDVGYVEEGLGPNVDEEIVEEDREDDLEQVMLMTTARTMKLAKSMSEVDATDGRREERILLKKVM